MENLKILTLKDFSENIDDAEVTNITISVGDIVNVHESIIIVETSKTTVDLSCPLDGTISELYVKVGDKINEDTELLCLKISANIEERNSTNSILHESQTDDIETDLVVIGGGPAGYTAAFRAADLGMKTVIIDKYSELGGTCLNSGCIPSKFLLHIVSGIKNAIHLSSYGVKFDEPYIDLKRMMQAKDNVINSLNLGLSSLSKKRDIKVIHGAASFHDKNSLEVVSDNKERKFIKFNKAIIATGSIPREIDSLDLEDPRIFYSEQALNIPCLPKKLLVVGGGVIGLELSSVFHGLGASVTVIEATKSFLSMLDEDIVRPLIEKYQEDFDAMLTDTVLDSVKVSSSTLSVTLKQGSNVINADYDAILIATGRKPNTQELNLEAVNINTNDSGFIEVNHQYITSENNIFAIGDVIGNPMLAHKGSKEGRIVAEMCAGQNEVGKVSTMPFVVYTDPEIAWVGLTEKSASNDIDVIKIPWSSNGRALTQDSSYGITKLLIDRTTGIIVGGGLIGPNVGEMISEITLAVENQLTAKDLSAVIHPHPTVSETISMCAEKYLNEAIEIMNQ